MKKYFMAQLTVIFTYVSLLSSTTYAQGMFFKHPTESHLSTNISTNNHSWTKKRDLDPNALFNMNAYYSSSSKPIKIERVKTNDKFVQNTLLFHDILTKDPNFKDLVVQFDSEDQANMFLNKEVDISAIDYAAKCYGGKIGKTKCTYGGVTISENNKTSEQNILVGISLNDEKLEARYDIVNTFKKEVTIQELDKQIRDYLIKHYKIYDPNSTIQSGYIDYKTKDRQSFKYDIYNKSGIYGDDFLKIYKNNQTVKSNNVEIDVQLFTS